MRSGTSKGPFIDVRDLPASKAARDGSILRIMGTPHPQQIDGLGGNSFVTSKVVLVKPSQRKGIDVDYLFAQVSTEAKVVDTTPNCGNMLAGVGPFAIEQGWVQAMHPETRVMVFNKNTQTDTEIIVPTPQGQVNYSEGDFCIDGVLGSAAPIALNLLNIGGGATGKLFPTGTPMNQIDDISITLIDCGNLVMLLSARQWGITGTETVAELTQCGVCDKIEPIRQQAAKLAGMGDVANSVLPKVAILTTPQRGGSIKSVYLTPKTIHPAHAVTGAIAIAAACMIEHTVATTDIIPPFTHNKQLIEVEHPAGKMPIQIEMHPNKTTPTVLKAGVLRTVKKIMQGCVYY